MSIVMSGARSSAGRLLHTEVLEQQSYGGRSLFWYVQQSVKRSQQVEDAGGECWRRLIGPNTLCNLRQPDRAGSPMAISTCTQVASVCGCTAAAPSDNVFFRRRISIFLLTYRGCTSFSHRIICVGWLLYEKRIPILLCLPLWWHWSFQHSWLSFITTYYCKIIMYQ